MEIVCPHCHTASVHGVAVCVGCQAEVVYGSTFKEVKNAAIFGGIAAGAFYVIFITYLFSFSFLLLAVCAVVGAFFAVKWIHKLHLGQVRFFRLFLHK